MFAHSRTRPNATRLTTVTLSRATDRTDPPGGGCLQTGGMTPPSPPDLDPLHQSEQRLLRTVDSLTADRWTEPSLLPGWTRAHVVAHLALNAEGLAGAVDGLAHEQVVPVYASNERRDGDIEELARADRAEIRERLFAGSQLLRDALATLAGEQWSGSVRRLPDGPHWPVATIPTTRRREVEIHHADLGAGYAHRDWPSDFAVELLDSITVSHASSPDSPAFTVRAGDTGRTWSVGADEPVVEGAAADLGWWLTGRGAGEGLTCNAGALPTLGPWPRTPAK